MSVDYGAPFASLPQPMFGAIKRFFKKDTAEIPPAESAPFSAPTPGAAKSASTAAKPATTAAKPTIPGPSSQTTLTPRVEQASASAPGESIRISFEAIVPVVPKQLIKKVETRALSEHFLSLRKDFALEQLATGSVKVPLSTLRASGPNGLFVSGQDAQMVDLPLKEIIAQLSPASLPRRNTRRTVEVPNDIADVFGPKGSTGVRFLDKSEVSQLKPTETPTRESLTEHLTASAAESKTGEGRTSRITKPIKKGVAAPIVKGKAQPTPAPAPPPTMAFPQPKAGDILAVPLVELLDDWPEPVQLEIAYQNLSEASCRLPVTEVMEGLKRRKLQYPWKTIRAWIDAKIDSSPSPHGDVVLELPVKSVMSRFFAYQANKTSEKPAETAPAPVPPPAPAKPSQPITFNLDPPAAAPSKAAPAPSKAAPAPIASAPVPSVAASAATDDYVEIPLDSVKAQWPEAIRKEITQSGAKLRVPTVLAEAGLRSGKVNFKWQEVRAWVEPALSEPTTQGDQAVEVPLAILAPIFLQKRRPSAGRKTELPGDIPDVFNSGKAGGSLGVAIPVEPGTEQPGAAPRATPRPAAPTAPAPAAAGTTAPAQAVTEAAPAPKKKAAQNIAEIFGQPGKKNWTPNEIVHQTTILPNVAGAMIVLQDGLLVASCMPPNWKTETVAAFVPQIFGRLRQYSKDLDMGELVSVSFGVQQGTLEIFNAGIIYFAALSRPGEQLPLDELATIARELSRHTK